MNNKIKLISLFSGIGAFEEALRQLDIPFNIEVFCEYDTNAIKSYCELNNIDISKNLGDITKIDIDNLNYNDIDLLTWGFPCQDISTLGKQLGAIKNKTRSGLYYNGLDLLNKIKPKYSIIENVKGLKNEKFKPFLTSIYIDLDKAGYNSFECILNSKDYGSAQNRERIFIISIRKDIEQTFLLKPKRIKNKSIIDILDTETDLKEYIIKDKHLNNIRWFNNDIPYKVNSTIKIGEVTNITFDNSKRIHSIYGLSPTLTTTAPPIIKDTVNNMIRFLTPLERFRLQNFTDDSFNKIDELKLSKYCLYGLAGNSINVNVLKEILTELFKNSKG